MYKKINIAKQIVKDAEDVVMNMDRSFYDSYFKTAEEYCAKNNVLIGGQNGMDMLCAQPKTINSYIYYLYCDNAFDTAKGLTIALYKTENKHIPKESILLETNITYKEFTIYINTRESFKIYALDKYKNVSLLKLIGPETTKGYFNTEIDVQVISGEVYLIEIYRKLYSPYADKIGGYKSYTYYRDVEEKVFNETYKSLSTKMVKTGGADENKMSKADIEIMVISQMILNNTNRIVIGDYAISALVDVKQTGVGGKRLQIITDESINEFVQAMEKLTGQKLSFATFNLNIPDDFQILKHTVYIASNDQNHVPLLDVFNSTSYELIPYISVRLSADESKLRGKALVGNLYVLMRFKFIDLWALKLILNIGTTNADFMRGKIRETLADIKLIRGQINESKPADLFQFKHYLGVYIDEKIAKKKLIKDEKIRHKRFYPSD